MSTIELPIVNHCAVWPCVPLPDQDFVDPVVRDALALWPAEPLTADSLTQLRANLLEVIVVFTVPAEVAEIAFHNKAAVYDLLFHAASETMLTIAADPRHWGARIWFGLHSLTRRADRPRSNQLHTRA